MSALTEEVEFLRQREADVQERENNLQMIAEMNRKLGTTVSKFELDAMRGQIDSLEEEARRAILAQFWRNSAQFCAILRNSSDAPPPLQVAELKAELENRKLPSDGKKADLIARLHAAPDLARRMPQRRASVPPGAALADLTLPMALRLLSLPLPMGSHPDGSGEITLKNGRFGPSLELVRAANGEPAPPVVSVSLPKAVSIFDVELPQAAELLDRKRARDIARGKAKA